MGDVHPYAYVVMGVAGAGKTEIGAAFARALGVAFVEGDAHHSAANVVRMAAGVPLTDDDRQGWLSEIASVLRGAQQTSTGVVVSCSALKRRYRDMLRREASAVRFIYLSGTPATLRARLAQRRGHFMPPSLLDSQLATLEPPTEDEGAWECNIDDSPTTIVQELLMRVRAPQRSPNALPSAPPNASPSALADELRDGLPGEARDER